LRYYASVYLFIIVKNVEFRPLSATFRLMVVELSGAKERMSEVMYRRARHVISENQRCVDAAAALRADDYVSFGRLMTASHHSLRSVQLAS